MPHRFVVMTGLLSVVAAALALSPPSHAETITAVPVRVTAGLDYPAMFTVTPTGSLLVAERKTGDIVEVDPGTGSQSLVSSVTPVCTSADQGLFGVAVPGSWPSDRTIWAYATRLVGGTCANQVLRINHRGRMTVVHSEAYTGEHIGGKVAFGPDGFVYVSTGEGGNATPHAQDLSSGKGKVLRFADNGRPAGVVGSRKSPVFAFGFRNVFGFDFDPATGALWAADNGPDCNDEINRVVPGGNYGWGANASCLTPPEAPVNTNQDGPSPVLPEMWWSPSNGPTGATFCDSCGLWLDGQLLVGTYNDYVTGDIWAVQLSPDRLTAVTRVSIARPSPPPLAVESAPGGPVYYSDLTGSIWRLEAAT